MKKALLGLVVVATCSFTPPARAEVNDCNVIAALPIVITTRGVFCLKSDLNFSSDSGRAIDVRESFVTIELNGFLLNGLGAGPDTNATAIYSRDRRGITVRNGTIRGFSRAVHMDGASAYGHLIEDLRLDQTRVTGIAIHGSGSTVRRNRVLSTGGSTHTDSALGVQVFQARAIAVLENQISSTGGSFSSFGILVESSDLVEARGNSVHDTVGGETGFAILASNSTNVTIDGNRALNGATLGNFGIIGSGGSGIVCLNNVAARFSNPSFTGCTGGSNNQSF